MIWTGAGTDSSEQHSFISAVTSWISVYQNEDEPPLRVETVLI